MHVICCLVPIKFFSLSPSLPASLASFSFVWSTCASMATFDAMLLVSTSCTTNLAIMEPLCLLFVYNSIACQQPYTDVQDTHVGIWYYRSYHFCILCIYIRQCLRITASSSLPPIPLLSQHLSQNGKSALLFINTTYPRVAFKLCAVTFLINNISE